MMWLHFILMFGFFTVKLVAQPCPLIAKPEKVAECLRYLHSVAIGAAKRDMAMICSVAADIAVCTQRELGDCVAEAFGKAALEQVEELAVECCPDRNARRCPIRDSLIQEQRCFAADSLVTLSNGKQKSIGHLQPGDSVLAYNHQTKQIQNTNLLTMLDFQPNQFAMFKQIVTTTGRHLSLTSSHLIPTAEQGYVMAKNIHTGMNVYVMNADGILSTETVSNVSNVVKQGYLAPLTDEGTLLVNNIAASCYATIDSHNVAHTVLAPMRWWYRLFGFSKSAIGIHWFPKLIYDMTSVLLPSIIQN